MNELITSFLIQNKQCLLPGIGKFSLKRACAINDVAAKKILPPETEVVFSPNGMAISERLPEYIAGKKSTTLDEAHKMIEEWTFDTKSKLSRGEGVSFPSLGTLVMSDGKISFENVHPHLFSIVTAERVIHENDSHKVLVGDKETDSSAVKELIHPAENDSRKWWKAALILFLVGLVILIFYFLSDGFGIHLHPEPAPATYISK